MRLDIRSAGFPAPVTKQDVMRTIVSAPLLACALVPAVWRNNYTGPSLCSFPAWSDHVMLCAKPKVYATVAENQATAKPHFVIPTHGSLGSISLLASVLFRPSWSRPGGSHLNHNRSRGPQLINIHFYHCIRCIYYRCFICCHPSPV